MLSPILGMLTRADWADWWRWLGRSFWSVCPAAHESWRHDVHGMHACIGEALTLLLP